MNFYKIKKTGIIVNVNEVLAVGEFKTYTDTSKSQAIFKYSLKMKSIVKGFPFSLDISEADYLILSAKLLEKREEKT